MRKGTPRLNYDLFADRHHPVSERPELGWPEPGRFPLNLGRAHVEDVLLADLKAAGEVLIATGYAALDRIIDLVADADPGASVRILLGSEPFDSNRDSFTLAEVPFPKEVERYWLDRGVSLLLSAKLIACIERLKSGRVQARYVSGGTRLHAKLYCTERAATVGSSNFTRPGMRTQLEANARFEARADSDRYRELRSVAENYWDLGRDYNDDLTSLLNCLLKLVTWQEALARACAELLEGEWASAYLRGQYLPNEGGLWPSQRQGIAQALYVLTNRGSVLIADATGSGKTRMGVHLIGAVAHHNLRSGRLRHDRSVMVCPPAVADNWDREAVLAGVHLDVYSHGSLSHTRSRRHEITLEQLRRAQILSVDEGHNFLNLKSARTQNLLRHMADHVMLFTATPINRSVVDLLRVADMLGADNLEDSTLDMFKVLLTRRSIDRSLADEEIQALRREIQRFTVRRTKKTLNALIAREPDQYRDRYGKPCRFPKHKARTYTLNESPTDRKKAAEIRQLADQLLGVSHFQKRIEMPDVLRRRNVSEEQYLVGRLTSARKIAKYVIMACLRSSRTALDEHIVGTKQAKLDFGLEDFRKHADTGNILGTLARIAGHAPQNRLSIDLPEWLADPDAHAVACEHDAGIYRRIYELVQDVSDGRERGKAEFLLRLLKNEPVLLAFDSHPITLHAISKYLGIQDPKLTYVIATGDPNSDRDLALQTFGLESDVGRAVGLCSDSLSEGVNLQRASALVHLDMPSVVRVAEQRVGRVDRLDSPHESIEAWWPEDAPEFALSSDERFLERYETVDALLGSNMPLPEAMQHSTSKPVDVRDLIEEFEREGDAQDWDGIHDAFEPVRKLVSGERAIVDQQTYDHYRTRHVRVLSRVSLVKSKTPWAFFCVAGGAFGAPRWVFLPSLTGAPITELGRVSEALRERLTLQTRNLKMNATANKYLEQFVRRLSDAERGLLPRKKQRALEEMKAVLERYERDAAKRKDQDSVDSYKLILDALRQPSRGLQPDWDEIASRWLDLIRPLWYQKLQEPRTRPLLLRDIRKDLLPRESEFGPQVIESFASFPALQPPEERISACIIGVAGQIAGA